MSKVVALQHVDASDEALDNENQISDARQMFAVVARANRCDCLLVLPSAAATNWGIAGAMFMLSLSERKQETLTVCYSTGYITYAICRSKLCNSRQTRFLCFVVTAIRSMN